MDGALRLLERHYEGAVFHGGKNDQGYWIGGSASSGRWAFQRNAMASVDAAYIFARVMMEEFHGA